MCDYCGDTEYCECNICGECGELRDSLYCENCGYCDCDDCLGSYSHGENSGVERDSDRYARCTSCAENCTEDAYKQTLSAHPVTEYLLCSKCAAESGTVSPVWDTPLTFTYGVEVEISQDCNHAGRVLDILYSAGLVQTDYLHAYHCRCSECATADISAQEDSTASAEYVTRTLQSQTPRDMAVLNALTGALVTADADISGEVGAHCNIGYNVAYPYSHGISQWYAVHNSAMSAQQRTAHRLAYLLGAHSAEWEKLAAQGQGYLRGYNGSPRYLSASGSGAELLRTALNALDHLNASQWLAVFPDMARDSYQGKYAIGADMGNLIKDKGNRWEFRLWNGTRTVWRAQLAVAISAAAVAYAESTLPLSSSGLLWNLSPFLSAAHSEAALMQLRGEAPQTAKLPVPVSPNIG